jgi:hypothetical protein
MSCGGLFIAVSRLVSLGRQLLLTEEFMHDHLSQRWSCRRCAVYANSGIMIGLAQVKLIGVVDLIIYLGCVVVIGGESQ